MTRVMRATTVCGATVNVSLVNVRRIFSSEAMAALEGIQTITPNLTSTKAGLVYGWLKRIPTVTISSAKIEQEWVYGLWSTQLYGDLL